MLTNVLMLKLNVEKYSVVSTLSKVVNINAEIRNVDLTLFDVVNSTVEIYNIVSNVDLTLSQVATSYQPKDNIETTLKRFREFVFQILIILRSKRKFDCLLSAYQNYFPTPQFLFLLIYHTDLIFRYIFL